MFELFTKLADIITYDVLKLVHETKLADSVHFFIEDTTKIFFLLAVMVYLISFGRLFVSSKQVRVWLAGKSRFTGYGLAAALGAITPFCSCSSVPLFIAFLLAGIPLGVTMAFLIASPLISEVVVILLGKALGLTFTCVYVVTGMLLGMIGGFVIDLFKCERWVEPYVWQSKIPKTSCCSQKKSGWKWREEFARAETKHIIRRVWLYVLIGVGLGAALHGYVPQKWFLKYAGVNNPFAVPFAVLVGIPLYANAVGVIPLAEVLIEKGVPVGTVLAFIMSIVGISFPEVLILRKVLKVKMLIFFCGFIFFALVIVGYLFNFIFG